MAEDYLRLRAIPLFASLKSDELAFIGSIVKQTTYPANAAIITQGDQGETFYIVASGQVRVVRQNESGAKVAIRLLGQGGILANPACWMASRATQPSRPLSQRRSFTSNKMTLT